MSNFIFRTEEMTNEQIQEFYVENADDIATVQKLSSRNPVLLVGSRGVGKTFLFRVAQSKLSENFSTKKILPVYITFRKASVIQVKRPIQFQSWMLSRICSNIIIQLHRALEENTAEPIVVVVQRTLNGCQDGPRDVGRVVLGAEITHVKAQGLIDEFAAALTVICFQPAVHAADHAGAQPDRSTFLIIIHFSSLLSVTSVKIAAKPCKHGTLPNDRLRLSCKTAKPTSVGVSLKSPALRGFVSGPHA